MILSCSALEKGSSCLTSVKGCSALDNYVNPMLKQVKQFEDVCIQGGFLSGSPGGGNSGSQMETTPSTSANSDCSEATSKMKKAKKCSDDIQSSINTFTADSSVPGAMKTVCRFVLFY